MLNEILESAIFIFKLNTNFMSIHINIKFHNTIFDALHYKNAFEISVSKILHELYILRNFRDSDDIV